ncbi:unnamed protein product [Camellia sinensis]
MCRECVSLELSVLDDDSILEHQVQEIDAIFSPNGGFTSQLLVWFPTRLDHSMACVHVCIQVVGLDPKLDYGSVCWISGWQMEMFNRCRCQVQKGGAVESVSVGEIRVRLWQSLVKLGVGFISKDPKLQVLICDLEVVMRPSGKSTQKSRSRRSRSSGRGKWMVVANMARFLSVSINELVVKCVVATSSYSWNKVDQGTKDQIEFGYQIMESIKRLEKEIPKLDRLRRRITSTDVPSNSNKWPLRKRICRLMPRATIEVKELRVDISKDGGSKPTLFVKLYLLPIVVHLGDPRVSYGQSSNFNHGGYTSTSHVSSALMEKTSAPFYCEELTLSSEFWGAGVVIKNVDITSGEVTLNLNEELFLKTKGSSDAFSHAAEVVESSVEPSPAKKPQKKQATLLSVTKYASIIPEKMGFSRSRAEEALGQVGSNSVELVLSAPYLPSTPTPKMQLDHTAFEAKAYVSCQFHVLPELLAAMVQISGPPSRPLHPNSRDSSPLVEQ